MLAKLRGSIVLLRDATGVLGLWMMGLCSGDTIDGVDGIFEGGALMLLFLSPMLVLNSNG